MLEMIQSLLGNNNIINVITAIVTVASAIAAVTPTPAPESAMGKLYKIIDWLALNIGKAKDKGEPTPPPAA